MRSTFKNLKPYFSLVSEFPLHFVAAYSAALSCTLLLTLQPQLLKAFINEAQRGTSKNHLFAIILFMLSALLLAFVFDTVQVSMTKALQLKIENFWRVDFNNFFRGSDQALKEFATRRGIFGLTSFTLLVTLDILLVFTNIVVVCLFVGWESPIVGFLIFLLCGIGIYLTFLITLPLGRISKFKEHVKGEMLNERSSDHQRYSRVLNYLFKKEEMDFTLNTLIVLLRFSLLKVLPALILIYFVFGREFNSGQVASLFLYFSLLSQPFSRLTIILRDSIVLYNQNAIVRPHLETIIPLNEVKNLIPRGSVYLKNYTDHGNLFPIKSDELRITNQFDENIDFVFDYDSKSLGTYFQETKA